MSARFGPRKVAFPVSGAAGYARFEHVRGIPAGDASEGLSVNRLFILDSLIGRYARVTGRQAGAVEAGDADVSNRRIAEEVQRLNDAVQRSVYGDSYGNGIYETGSVFSIAK